MHLQKQSVCCGAWFDLGSAMRQQTPKQHLRDRWGRVCRPVDRWQPLLVACVLVAAPRAYGQQTTYWQDVRPILRKHCTVCHSQKNIHEPEVSGGIALDSFEALVGARRKLVEPGKGEQSLLYRVLITRDEDRRMPKDSPPLPQERIEIVKRWIDGGALEGTRPGTVAARERIATRRRYVPVSLPTQVPAPPGMTPSAGGTMSLVLPVGPLAPVTAVAFSADRRWLAAGSYGQVIVWDLQKAAPEKRLTNVLGAVHDVEFTPDGQRLIVAGGQASARGEVRVFNCRDWSLEHVYSGHQDVVAAVAVSADSSRMLTGSYDKTVRLWQVHPPRMLGVFSGHSDFVYSVAMSADGQWGASASKDRSVKVFTLPEMRSRLTLSGMNEDVVAVAVSPDGTTIVSSGFEPSLVWWDAQTGQRRRSQGAHGGPVYELAFSRAGDRIVSASEDGTVRIWDARTFAVQRTVRTGEVNYSAALSSDGTWLAVGSFDGRVRLYDVATSSLLAQWISTVVVGAEGKESWIWLVMVEPGYVNGSEAVRQIARWHVGTTPVADERAWGLLADGQRVARGLRGEKIPVPKWGTP
ncbi:MAG: hypothetical protein C4297_09115 [Gemmataceae bacterium]